MSGHLIKDKRAQGFTLVEVAIAVAILGLAMTTLIGLQSRFVANYIQDREITRAVLIAQYIMTSIETADRDPDLGSSEKDLISELEAIGYFDSEGSEKEKEHLLGWRLTQEVTSINIHELEDLLRRIDLTIHWGEKKQQTHKLSYFIKTTKGR